MAAKFGKMIIFLVVSSLGSVRKALLTQRTFPTAIDVVSETSFTSYENRWLWYPNIRTGTAYQRKWATGLNPRTNGVEGGVPGGQLRGTYRVPGIMPHNIASPMMNANLKFEPHHYRR